MKTKLDAVLRLLFMLAVAYPVAWLWLGLRVRHRERLPRRGPAIVVANHNSHLDFMVLLALFAPWRVPGVRPTAAADYFCQNKVLSWLARHFVGIIPVVRGGWREGGPDPLAACCEALAAGQVVLLFPEGTRGVPEQLAELKTGVWHLARRFPAAPVVPLYLHGLGRALPKGALLPRPLAVRGVVGPALHGHADKDEFMTALRARFGQLQRQACAPAAARPTRPTRLARA